MLDFLIQINQGGSAIVVAIIAAVVAAIGWIIPKIYDYVLEFFNHRKNRNKVFIDFFIDTIIRLKNQKEVFSKENIELLKEMIKNNKKSFRPYIAKTGDIDSMKNIKEYKQDMSNREIAIIDLYCSYVELLDLYYDKLSQDEFVNLDLERKLKVIDYLWVLADETTLHAENVIEELIKRPALSEINRAVTQNSINLNSKNSKE